MIKLKRDFKYSLIYILNLFVRTLYTALTYFKSYNKFYEDVSIAKDLSIEDMFDFSHIVEIQGQSECVTERNISGEKEMT